MIHVQPEHLIDLALGTLTQSMRVSAERHVAGCATCRQELGETHSLLAELPLELPRFPPAPAHRTALLQAAAATPQHGRLHRFAADVARLIDITVERARELLTALERPASWGPGFSPAIRLCHVSGGAAVAGAVTGFVRMDAGSVFPPHRHLGAEWGLILQGALLDDDGRVYQAGDVAEHEADSVHQFSAGFDDDLIYLTVIERGVEVGGVVYSATDPRL